MEITKFNIQEIIDTNFELDRKKDCLSDLELDYLDTLSDHELDLMINHCSTRYNYFNAVQKRNKKIYVKILNN